MAYLLNNVCTKNYGIKQLLWKLSLVVGRFQTQYIILMWAFTGWPKKLAPFLYAITLPNINRFSKLFHCRNQEKICNNTITKDTITPKCVATLPREISSVLKETIENKTTSVTTQFKKLTTRNNLFIVFFCIKMFNVSVHLAAGRCTQAGDATDHQWRDTWHFTR